jgi:hypothetical protein
MLLSPAIHGACACTDWPLSTILFVKGRMRGLDFAAMDYSGAAPASSPEGTKVLRMGKKCLSMPRCSHVGNISIESL